MTRKDYELIARALRETRPETEYQGEAGDIAFRTWAASVHAIADALPQTNPSFDRLRFLRACGAGAGETFQVAPLPRRAVICPQGFLPDQCPDRHTCGCSA